MKKNLFFGLMALAGLFTSCSQDDAYAPPTANSNQVSMNIEMPADFAKTRAVPTAPSGHKLRCILEVWTDDGATLKVRKEQLATGTGSMEFKFELADQGKYKAVLWADYINDGTTTTTTATIAGLADVAHYADKYYKTDDATNGLKKVTIITDAYTYTADVREAFTAVTSFTKDVTAKDNLSATLLRPLTKVTIAEKNAEMFSKCTNMTAAYTVPSEFNAFTETVSTTATHDASYNAAPTGTDLVISGNTYKILFTDYVLTATADDGMMSGIELTFTGTGIQNNKKSIPTGIPLKRNNWVRAAGNLITPAYDPNIAMTVDMTTDWVEHNAPDIPDAFVGDYYYDDETYSTTLDNTKTCIGIVYEVNADGKSGKIVGLTQNDPQKSHKWSTENVETGATNTTDGRANMATIAALIANSNGSKSWDTYPAFKWVAVQNGKEEGGWDATNDKWYLPAKDELSALYTAYNTYGKDNFNTKLTAANGTALSNVYYYWSSTEYSSTNGWYMSFSSSGSGTGTSGKIQQCLVRCIRVFECHKAD